MLYDVFCELHPSRSDLKRDEHTCHSGERIRLSGRYNEYNCTVRAVRVRYQTMRVRINTYNHIITR